MKPRLATFFLFLFALIIHQSSFITPAQADLADCIEATCRISAPDGGVGTGCVFERSNGTVFVLSCAHVVGNAQTVQCEFWHRGHQSRPLTARVVARRQDVDGAVAVIPEAAFAGNPPAVVPLAKGNVRLAKGQTVTSVGCPRGEWSTAWAGHVVGYSGADGTFLFRPTPAGGRSGSAIFDAEGEQIVGLLFGQDPKGEGYRWGYASTAAQLRKAFGNWGNQSRSRLDTTGWQPAQCPDGDCQTQTPWPFGPGRLIPYRGLQDGRDQQQDQRLGQLEQRPVYPTLPVLPPAQQLPAPQADVDMSRVEERLDRITTLLETMMAAGVGQAQPPPTVEQERAVAELEATTRGAVADMKATTQGAVAELKAEDNRLSGLLSTLVGDLDTLPERMEARLAKVTAEQGDDARLHEIAAAYAKDFAGEKLESGELGQSAGYALAGQLGLGGLLATGLGLGGWLIGRRVGNRLQGGEALITERLFAKGLETLGLGDKKAE